MFNLDCHGQTSLKVSFVTFSLVFMKFRKLEKDYTEKTNNLISIKLKYFHCLSHFLHYETETVFKILFWNFHWTSSTRIQESSIDMWCILIGKHICLFFNSLVLLFKLSFLSAAEIASSDFNESKRSIIDRFVIKNCTFLIKLSVSYIKTKYIINIFW